MHMSIMPSCSSSSEETSPPKPLLQLLLEQLPSLLPLTTTVTAGQLGLSVSSLLLLQLLRRLRRSSTRWERSALTERRSALMRPSCSVLCGEKEGGGQNIVGLLERFTNVVVVKVVLQFLCM